MRRENGSFGLGIELNGSSNSNNQTALTIDVEESTEKRIERLIRENQVIIFSKRSCCMCHVMKRLLYTLGANPTVIEIEENEMKSSLPATQNSGGESGGGGGGVGPVVYVGGGRVGGLESLMALHLSGELVVKLREVGAAV
ncbi:hypothetical protein C5167_020271 [Papaver somniferum]|uniref:Glutaredoxin domain-containing protein n=1 Tax=Papaver somniferum TaxID=3469 RepID=A0A4Y7IUN0_PAPSO|nr:glutaredoxin-C6-like [Papaver somniferum]RZC51846.1 hypothetical protein C5167_020271 [Papaver somniferum]